MGRVKLFVIVGTLVVTGCSQAHHFPDMPLVPAGTGFQATETFSTDKMLSLCAAANTESASGGLAGKTDREIANGTCEFTAISVELIGRGSDPDQTCVAAAYAMMREFKQRFPDHDPKEVIGRC